MAVLIAVKVRMLESGRKEIRRANGWRWKGVTVALDTVNGVARVCPYG